MRRSGIRGGKWLKAAAAACLGLGLLTGCTPAASDSQNGSAGAVCGAAGSETSAESEGGDSAGDSAPDVCAGASELEAPEAAAAAAAEAASALSAKSLPSGGEAFEAYWLASGGLSGPLGVPAGGATCELAGGGCLQEYSGGTLYAAPSGLVVRLLPEIAERWAATGAETGPYGYPAAEHECSTGASGTSCWQRFDGGTLRWREDTGVVDCSVLECVALTFDDGPAPDTGRLLNTLVDKNVQATFFVLGNRLGTKYAPEFVRADQLGMEIGNHTWDHPHMRNLSAQGARDQLARTNDRIAEAIGHAPYLYRPPYGEHNATTDALAGEIGLAIIGWDHTPNDWQPQSAEQLVDRTLQGAQRGSIILLHDLHSVTVDAVPAIIDGLEERGFTVATVGDLLGPLEPGTTHWTGSIG